MIASHHDDLIALAHAAARAFAVAPNRPAGSDAAVGKVVAALEAGRLVPAHPDATGTQLRVCEHLGSALRAAIGHGGPIADLAERVERVSGTLVWERRPGFAQQTDPTSARFAEGHANALLLHTDDSEQRVVIGLSLVAPGVTYPDHHHPPEEVYVASSAGEWRHDERPWHEPGIGGIVHNPPDIVHAMRAGESPLFALWLHVDARTR